MKLPKVRVRKWQGIDTEDAPEAACEDLAR